MTELDSGWRRIAIETKADLHPFLLRDTMPADREVAHAALQKMELPDPVRVRLGILETDEPLDRLAGRGLSLMLLEADLGDLACEAQTLQCRYAPCLTFGTSLDRSVQALESACRVRVLTPLTGKQLQGGLELLLKLCLDDSMIERDGRWNLSWLREAPADGLLATGEGFTSLSRSLSLNKDRFVAERAVRHMLHNDRIPAVLLDNSWRVLDEPYRCSSFAVFKSVATESGFSLRCLIVPDVGGYLHLLFLARNATTSDNHLMDALSAQGAV